VILNCNCQSYVSRADTSVEIGFVPALPRQVGFVLSSS
jgi:hypothetical protein